MYGKLAITAVLCEDLEAMTAFYRDRLGLKVLAEQEGEIVLATGTGGGLILQRQDRRAIELVFTESDVRGAHGSLSDLKPSEIEPQDDGHGFHVLDPEGNSVHFVDH
ncbi:VOC family protein [Streptomyces sparsus]